MRKDTSARNSLFFVIITLAITASLFTFNYVRAGKNINKSAEIDSSRAAASFPGEENIRSAPPPVVEIKEKMFLAQVNDVYLNPEDYLGKIIKLEGIFKEEQGYEKSYCFVIRYGPGCCGNDGNAGFEVAWAKENARPYPAIDSWVEATGELKSYEEDGYSRYLYLDLSALNVLERRGAELVMQ